MATAATPTRSRNLAEAHTRVRSPLARLRGYIRTYVSLEGAAVLLVYLALWFWIGLLLDYGSFKAFTVDWVQDLPWSFRCGVLVLLVSGLLAAVALKVVTRLVREFRDVALALVLERRFGHILGDRLITAVELADTRQAAALGYSPAMVEETIHEAAQRVEQLPLKEVFDWKRLYRHGAVVLVLILGGYLLAGAGFSAVHYFTQGQTGADGFREFHDVSTIWFERNILLRNIIWPRRAHLELVGFPDSGEIRIGEGTVSPTIRVRALKFVIAGAPTSRAANGYRAWLEAHHEPADSLDEKLQAFRQAPPEGWRALSWFDLTPELLGAAVPDVAFPMDWEVRDPKAGLTVDEIELKLEKVETHKTLDGEVAVSLRNVLEQLEQRLSQAGLSRTLRKLTVPQTVNLIYRGKTTNSRKTLTRVTDNEYTGKFEDLKESVDFTVQGEDYYTARRHVIVVERPRLENLLREERRPAYLYYRPAPEGKAEDLRGLKQPFEASVVSVQGGDIAIDVPAGTDITLTATSTKPLTSARVLPGKTGVEVKASPVEMVDERTFRTGFKDVRLEQNFLFEFTDTDGVIGLHKVLIRPLNDLAPKIREFTPDDIIRKTKEGYMVAVGARIPFKGNVDDDHALAAVRYAYTIARMDSTARLNVKSLFMAGGGVPLFMGPNGFLAPAYLFAAAKEAAKPLPADNLPIQPFDLPRFDQMIKEHRLKDKNPDELLPMQTVREALAQKQKEPYRPLLRNFVIKPDEWLRVEEDPIGCDFPLWKSNLRVSDERQTQPRYKLDLWLEAVDNDLDSDREKDGRVKPHLSVSGEKYTFVVVSENELLTEIAKEEEVKYAELEAVFNRLVEIDFKLVQVNQDLSDEKVKAENLGPMGARCDQIGEVLEKLQNDTKTVYLAYERILRELKTNQVNTKIIDRVDKTIVKPLADIDGAEYDRTRDLTVAFRKALDNTELEAAARIAAARTAGAQAKEQMRKLKAAIEAVLGAMQGLTDVNKLIKILRDIEEQEQKQFDLIDAIKRKIEDKLIEEATGGKKPNDK
jgi:hypothetical protein